MTTFHLPGGKPGSIAKARTKEKRFDCYPEGSIILTQLGAIGNLGAALKH